MLISGRCACGNISFILDWSPDPTEIPARACTCSFCQAHKGIWTSSPSARLEVQIKAPERVDRHTFATGTAIFHICQECGDVPLVTSEMEGRLFAVVNVNALADIAPGLFRQTPADFDGESLEARLERRRQRWIADVTLIAASD